MYVTLFQQAGLILDPARRNYMGQNLKIEFAGLAHQDRRTKDLLVVSMDNPHENCLVTVLLIRSVTLNLNPDGKQNQRGALKHNRSPHGYPL